MSDDDVKPWDLLNNENYTQEDIRNARYEVCRSCDRFFSPTRMCKECGCFMAMKTWLKHANCPLHKW